MVSSCAWCCTIVPKECLPLSICSLNRLGGRKVAGGENEAKVKQLILWLMLLVMLLPR